MRMEQWTVKLYVRQRTQRNNLLYQCCLIPKWAEKQTLTQSKTASRKNTYSNWTGLLNRYTICTLLCDIDIHATFNHTKWMLARYNIKWAGLLPSITSAYDWMYLVIYSMHCQYGQVYSGNTSQPTEATVNRHHQATGINMDHQPTETILNKHHQPQAQQWQNITFLHQLPLHKILLHGLSH